MNQHNARQGDDLASSEDREIGEIKLNDWLRCAIERHEYGLVRYAQQFVVDVERSRDVVQDTFVKLCHYERSQGRLEGSQLTKWLYKVCRNRSIDVARKEKRMKSAPPSQFDEQFDTRADAPDAGLLAQERQETLLAQIANLTTNQQEVLRLKFHGGLSYREIAEVTGLTKSNVGFLLHTAITKLRQSAPTHE